MTNRERADLAIEQGMVAFLRELRKLRSAKVIATQEAMISRWAALEHRVGALEAEAAQRTLED
jgi:hypothetical protein